MRPRRSDSEAPASRQSRVRRTSWLFRQSHIGPVKQPQAPLEVCSQLYLRWIPESCNVRIKVLTDSIHKSPPVEENEKYLLLGGGVRADPDDWVAVTKH